MGLASLPPAFLSLPRRLTPPDKRRRQDTRYRKNKVTGEMELMMYRPSGSGCG